VILRVAKVRSISGGEMYEVRPVTELAIVQNTQLFHLVVHSQLLSLHHMDILHGHFNLIYYSLKMKTM
jgi:hypothetical protein